MRRLLLGGAVAALLTLAAPARGQSLPIPPLPPLPPEASLVLEYIAPVGSPVCGNAGFAVLLVQGTAAGLPVVLDLPTVFGPVFVICGAVPTPEQPLTCSPDVQLQGLLDQAFAVALGSTSLISGRLFGPVVEQVVVVQDLLPAPLNTTGLGATVVATLQCMAPAAEDEPAGPDLLDDSVPLTPVESLDLPPLSSAGELIGGEEVAASPLAPAPVPQQLGRAATVALIGGRDVAIVVYLLPLLLLALGVVVGRGLLVDLGNA